jgi:hypothetical protein
MTLILQIAWGYIIGRIITSLIIAVLNAITVKHFLKKHPEILKEEDEQL